MNTVTFFDIDASHMYKYIIAKDNGHTPEIYSYAATEGDALKLVEKLRQENTISDRDIICFKISYKHIKLSYKARFVNKPRTI